MDRTDAPPRPLAATFAAHSAHSAHPARPAHPAPRPPSRRWARFGLSLLQVAFFVVGLIPLIVSHVASTLRHRAAPRRTTVAEWVPSSERGRYTRIARNDTSGR